TCRIVLWLYLTEKPPGGSSRLLRSSMGSSPRGTPNEPGLLKTPIPTTSKRESQPRGSLPNCSDSWSRDLCADGSCRLRRKPSEARSVPGLFLAGREGIRVGRRVQPAGWG